MTLASRRFAAQWYRVVGMFLLACGPLAGIDEKPCRPGCVDEHTQLVCDASGVARAVRCEETTKPCAETVCRQGSCVERPAVGAVCGPKGLAHCNEGYACLGPDLRLSAGYAHTCVIGDDGRVWCWGANDYGQLGDGTVMSRYSPVPVAGLPNRAIAISGGSAHTCALIEGGDAYCWGDNDFAKVDGLFDPAPSIGAQKVTEARRVEGVPDGVHFSDIRAAGAHTLALTPDGRVFCWGANHAGQCGLDRVEYTGPTQIAGLDRVTSVEAVKNHSCAVRSVEPSLVCWGDNQKREGGLSIVGKLGPNAAGLAYSAKPVPVQFIEGGTIRQVLKVGVGLDSTYAAVVGGTAYAFGSNLEGQLGTGSTESAVATPSPVQIRSDQSRTIALQGIPSFIRLGALNQCVETTSTSVDFRYACWGTDYSGELGLGSPTGQVQKHATPVSVLPPNARNMVHGVGHACVTVATDVRTEILCYGDGALVGNGSKGSLQPQFDPAPVMWESENLEGAK